MEGKVFGPGAKVDPAEVGYFPKARIISQVEAGGGREEEKHVIKIVETKMQQPYVRLEETYSGKELVDQLAMVANELIVQKPEAMADTQFTDILARAGAVSVRRAGENFVAVFPADPDNPKSLDGFIRAIRAAAPTDFWIEPNFIRKLF